MSTEELDQNVAAIGALAYLFPPLVPAVILLGDLGGDPVLRQHARQALIWTVGFALLLGLAIAATVWLVSLDFLAICLMPVLLTLPFVPGAIWAKRVYLGQPVRIRLVSRLAKSWDRSSAGA